jgi:hypothetical protein
LLGAKPLTLEIVRWSPPTSRESDGSGEPRGIAVVRMIGWDQDNGSIRDIKEQEVYMEWPAFYEDRERTASFFAALGRILEEIETGVAETLMPSDLVHTTALALKRARTQEDFDTALRAKSRLGKYLRPATSSSR